MHTIPIEIFDQEIRIPELKNLQHIDIIKLCNSDDLDGLNDYFNNNIFKYCSKSNLNILERFYILLAIKILCVDRMLRLKDELNRGLEYDLMIVLNKIETVDYNFEKQIQVDGVTLNLNLPNCIYFKSPGDIFLEIIDTIKIGDDIIKFSKYSLDDKNYIFQQLPSKVFNQLQHYINEINDAVVSIELLEENEQFGFESVKLNITNNTLIHIIKMLFQQNINSYYENMFHFLNKICQDSNLFFNLTPSESYLFMNLYNEEIKRQNEQQQSQQNSGVNVPSSHIK